MKLLSKNKLPRCHQQCASKIDPENDNPEASAVLSTRSTSPSFSTETTTLQPQEVTTAGPNDVLLGRGLACYNHSGNVKFRKLIQQNKLRYVACTKMDKPVVAKELVKIWKSQHGRFLTLVPKKDTEGKQPPEWIEVSDRRAQEKTSQCLRERTPDVLPYYKLMREFRKEKKALAEKSGKNPTEIDTLANPLAAVLAMRKELSVVQQSNDRLISKGRAAIPEVKSGIYQLLQAEQWQQQQLHSTRNPQVDVAPLDFSMEVQQKERQTAHIVQRQAISNAFLFQPPNVPISGLAVAAPVTNISNAWLRPTLQQQPITPSLLLQQHVALHPGTFLNASPSAGPFVPGNIIPHRGSLL